MHFRVLLSVFCVLMYAGLVHASPFAYLANNGDNTVSVLDTATNTVVGSPIPVGQEPYGVAVNQQGSRVYVSNQIDKTISVIDTALLPYTGVVNPVVATIQLDNTPGGLAVNAAGTRLFVALNDAAGVDVFNTLTNARITSVTVANIPEGIAAVQAPGVYKVLVTNMASDSVSVIDVDEATDSYVKAATDITVGAFPAGIAVSPNGQFAYVANMLGNSVSRITLADSTATLLNSAPSLDGPFGVAINPANDKLYVTNFTKGVVTVYDLTANTNDWFSLDGIKDGDPPLYGPRGIAVAPSGKIYTANNTTNTASILNSNGTVDPASPVAVGTAPVSLGKFMGSLLHPIGITTSYGGYIYPADPLISLSLDGATVLAADGKDLVLNILPDHNFATTLVKINSVDQPQPFQPSYTFGNVTSANTIEAAFGRTHWDLTITKNLYSGEGIGRVYSSVGGLDCTNELPCNPDGQTASIPVGGSVIITAVASSADNSEFIGWGGNFCSGNSPTCIIASMSNDIIVNAHFVKKNSGPVRIGSVYYATLAEAYAAAASGAVIEMLTFDALGNPLTIPAGFYDADNVTVTLIGGFTEWTVPTLPAGSATTIQGPVEIKNGGIIIGSRDQKGAVIIK